MDIRNYFGGFGKSKPKAPENGSSTSTKSTKGGKKKNPVIIDSDSDDDFKHNKTEQRNKRPSKDLNENEAGRRARKSKKSAVIFDSDSEEEKPSKSRKTTKEEERKTGSQKKATPKKKSPSPAKKAMSAIDFFGTQEVKQSEKRTPSVKRKAERSPEKDPALEIHDDDDFMETLRLLDEQPKKKAKVEEEPKSLASKLSQKSKHFVPDTPESKITGKKSAKETPTKKSPVKETPKKSSPAKGSTPPKVSPGKPTNKTPPKSSPKKVDTPGGEKTPLEKKASYRNYLSREGPRALGSKEIPQGGENCLEGLTFVITGVLESLERDEAKCLVEKYGGKVTGSVSKKTSYMVAGREAGESKMAKAQQFGTKIIDEDDLLNLIKTLPGKKSKYLIAAEKEAEKEKKEQQKKPTNKVSTPKPSASPAMARTPSTPKVPVKTESKPTPGTPSRDVDAKPESPENTLMWVDKYKPTSIKQIIGQQGDKSNAKKLINWLQNWHKNVASGKKPAFNRFNDDGSGHRAALLSGPPGVGKTTTATLVAKELGFSYVELNASDTRSKKSLKTEVAEALNNHTLMDFMGGSKSSSHSSDGHKHCLIMDEVDGMAGNEDRGGIQELVALIKQTKIPIICMCNDRNHQKMRTLSNYCFDLRFQRPRVEQIKSAMMTVAYKEKLKIPPTALNEMIASSNQDVRQVLHNLSMWTAANKTLTYEQIKEDSKKAKKDLKIGPFDVCRKVFVGGEETAGMTIHDKSDLFFHDYSIGPLFVQENYIHVTPYDVKGDTKKHLQLLSKAADSLAWGDTVDRQVRGSGNWGLLPLQAIFASVIPGETMRGTMGQMVQFPSWLGKNSTRNKNSRIAQELLSHMRLNVSCDKRGLCQDYLPHLRHSLTRPLIKEGTDGVADVIKLMDEYDLVREDVNSIIEVTQWPGKEDPMSKVETKVKSAFTRTYNKESHLTPYATGTLTKKTKRGGGGDNADLEGLEGEDQGQASSEEETEDVNTDSMIKQKKKPAGRGKSKEKDAGAKTTTKGKGKGKGRGKGKER